ncbi:alpha-2A adrenergic receptor-like [Chanos chanos]|uniref:Alpha-2A adrenergic receptor n=1 Tax=Chanos chanos TaxID=29144 RepID=A0A6J2WHN8_CHACN|nr:alpha-2A adrenergic receptor-like [Chanos chanos]
MGCNSSTNGTTSSPYTTQTSVPLTMLVCLLILLTVFGNVLVVIAVLTSRALKAPQNLFLVSLACADILVATLVMPFSLANELMGSWYFGSVWCYIYLALDVLFCTSSIVHLCAISLDRYWSVSRAIEYNMKRTPRRIKSIVLLVWVIAALISFPPLLSIGTGKDQEGDRCKISDEKWYILFSCTASFFAPCLIMILMYVRIYQIAKKRTRSHPGDNYNDQGAAKGQRGHARKDAQERQNEDGGKRKEGREGRDVNGVDVEECSSSDSNDNDKGLCSLKKKRGKTKLCQINPGNPPQRPQEQPQQKETTKVSRWKGRQNREKRFTFVLAVVMGVFVFCWFPFFFTYTLMALCDSCCVPRTLFKFFFWFGYCNSSLNPVIYTVFNNDFRRSFKKILCRRERVRET